MHAGPEVYAGPEVDAGPEVNISPVVISGSETLENYILIMVWLYQCEGEVTEDQKGAVAPPRFWRLYTALLLLSTKCLQVVSYNII